MILDTIAASTRKRVAREKTEIPMTEMKERASTMEKTTGFPFEQALRQQDINFICEVKKASPSKGIIVEEFPYLSIAKEYEEAGAAAVSVLTEPEFFLGDNRYLEEIAAGISIPVLRKDFTVDPYQIYQARVLGASAVLLICSLLSRDTLEEYLGICEELGLSALVEAHDEREITDAVAAGARMIGVNNRNLQTFEVNVENSRNLRSLVPPSILFVAESGIRRPQDVEKLRQAGVNGVLIGETLMKSPDKKRMLCSLRGE